MSIEGNNEVSRRDDGPAAGVNGVGTGEPAKEHEESFTGRAIERRRDERERVRRHIEGESGREEVEGREEMAGGERETMSEEVLERGELAEDN